LEAVGEKSEKKRGGRRTRFSYFKTHEGGLDTEKRKRGKVTWCGHGEDAKVEKVFSQKAEERSRANQRGG